MNHSCTSSTPKPPTKKAGVGVWGVLGGRDKLSAKNFSKPSTFFVSKLSSTFYKIVPSFFFSLSLPIPFRLLVGYNTQKCNAYNYPKEQCDACQVCRFVGVSFAVLLSVHMLASSRYHCAC